MLGSASPATASIHTSTSSATPTSPTRPSRLRGLSYLRTYTRDHLHGSGSGSGTAAPRAEQQQEQRAPLTRSTSYPAGGGHSRSNSASGIQSAENGWLPTVQGRSGLSREGTTQTSTSTDPEESQPAATTGGMTRRRAATVLGPTSAGAVAGAVAGGSARITTTAEGASTEAGMATAAAEGSSGKETQPTIRFIPHVEARSTRPSLSFAAVSRTLKGPSTVVRVGRYSERDTATADENTLPVGFKSKVVSRRHCEFWCTNGQWYVKDVKSSSGTFLNHVRLSSPGSESRPYPVNDGDVVQLGIDFKGGEEVIFRCVKIRIECNRGWQKTLNQFNTSTHKRLLKTALGNGNRDSDAASVNTSECSICLNPVAPCQALFVAPCSHVWHFKCVRNLINSHNYPNFLCPNCRFVADLEVDVEPPEEEELYEEFPPDTIDENGEAEQSGETGVSSDDAHDGAAGSISTSDDDREEDLATPNEETRIDNIDRTANITDEELAGLLSSASVNTPTPASALRTPLGTDATSSTTTPRAIAKSATKQRTTPSDLLGARSTTPTSTAQFALAAGVANDGPMTPRNDAGPFVFDGSPTVDASPRQVAQEGERSA